MFHRKVLAAVMISSLLLSGCGQLPPLAKEEHLLSTKIEGEKEYEGSFAEFSVSVDKFRDLTYIGVSETNPRKILFKEERDGKQTLIVREGDKEEGVASGNLFYETITTEGEVLYMLYDSANTSWMLKNRAAETLFTGTMASILKNTGTELIFAAKKADGANTVYYNGKMVWESPNPVTQFFYEPAHSRYVAVVQESNRNLLSVKTSFQEVPGIYQHLHGLQVDGEQIYFLAQKVDQTGEWTWYLNGKEKVLPFDVKEVHSVRKNQRSLGAILHIPQGWFFMSSDDEEVLLTDTPIGLVSTDKGWKAVLHNDTATYVYNLKKKRREMETTTISLITIDGGSDIWFAHRAGEEVHWKVNRGDTEVVVLLKYIAPISLNGQPYLLGEKANGSVDLYQLNP